MTDMQTWLKIKAWLCEKNTTRFDSIFFCIVIGFYLGDAEEAAQKALVIGILLSVFYFKGRE